MLVSLGQNTVFRLSGRIPRGRLLKLVLVPVPPYQPFVPSRSKRIIHQRKKLMREVRKSHVHSHRIQIGPEAESRGQVFERWYILHGYRCHRCLWEEIEVIQFKISFTLLIDGRWDSVTDVARLASCARGTYQEQYTLWLPISTWRRSPPGHAPGHPNRLSESSFC